MTPITSLERTIARGGPICTKCAVENGGLVVEGHVSTVSMCECIVCGEDHPCSDRSDWDFPWLRLRFGEREF